MICHIQSRPPMFPCKLSFVRLQQFRVASLTADIKSSIRWTTSTSGNYFLAFDFFYTPNQTSIYTIHPSCYSSYIYLHRLQTLADLENLPFDLVHLFLPSFLCPRYNSLITLRIKILPNTRDIPHIWLNPKFAIEDSLTFTATLTYALFFHWSLLIYASRYLLHFFIPSHETSLLSGLYTLSKSVGYKLVALLLFSDFHTSFKQ